MLSQGQDIGPDAGDQGQGLVPVDVGGHPGVHPGAHDINAQMAVAVDQVKGGLRSNGQPLQIAEQPAAVRAENL